LDGLGGTEPEAGHSGRARGGGADLQEVAATDLGHQFLRMGTGLPDAYQTTQRLRAVSIGAERMFD